jgi:uncharacterized membrane protein YbhN (UPF0104 family)
MRRSVWRWGRLVAPALVLAALVWRLGTSPFLAGLRTVDGGALAAAAGLIALATVCSAWRWTIVARGLGVDLSLRAAVAAYYRALFLNVTLPGGVAGDIHRGISHGRDVSDVSRALRSVAWERCGGQVVQIIATVVVLLVLPSPVHAYVPWVAAGIAAAACLALVLGRVRAGGTRSAWARFTQAVRGDIRDALLAPKAWAGIVMTSVLAVAGYAGTFLLAARTAGVSAPSSRMIPLALLVMTAMVLPNAGGWGPREGITAWAFGAAGLGVQRGVATAVLYGVMVLTATSPGAAVLVVAWFRRRRPAKRSPPRLRERPAHA